MSPSVLDPFVETGAYLKGHFCLTSGLHSAEYLQCAKVLQHPATAERFGSELALQLSAIHPNIDVVVAPAMGGLIIGHEVARALGCRFIFTERDTDSRMTLRRGFVITPGEHAVVIEDVITTGASSLEVVEIIRQQGAQAIAIGSIIDRSGGKADLGLPRVALAVVEVTAYSPDACPFCQQGLPLTKPGSRPAK